MSKNEKDDVAISFVQGEDYEQIKVSAGSKINPDPRVGGTSIMFKLKHNSHTKIKTKFVVLTHTTPCI
jgi:hypothetical protein